MAASVGAYTLAEVLDGLVSRALRADIPPLVAERARQATVKVLDVDVAAPASAAVRRRAEAYFSACVRRVTVRGGAGRRATARLVAEAVVADLLEAGRDSATTWRELERGWRERLPDDLLEEYRVRLCG